MGKKKERIRIKKKKRVIGKYRIIIKKEKGREGSSGRCCKC